MKNFHINMQIFPVSSTSALTNSASTTVSSIVDNDKNFCKNGDGYYQDPANNCKDYVFCAFSNTAFTKAFRYSCPDGLKFDNKIKACIRDAECGN